MHGFDCIPQPPNPPPPHAQVVFYDANGRQLQSFDFSNDEGVREFTSCAFNPSGDAAVFGTYNRFYVFAFNAGRNVWEQVRWRGGGCVRRGGVRQMPCAIPTAGKLLPKALERAHCSSAPELTRCSTLHPLAGNPAGAQDAHAWSM